MTKNYTPLSLVPAGAIATPAQLAAAAMHEARLQAAAHLQQLIDALEHAARLAQEVADGGDLYPAGIRDLAGRHGVATVTAVQTLRTLGARQKT